MKIEEVNFYEYKKKGIKRSMRINEKQNSSTYMEAIYNTERMKKQSNDQKVLIANHA